jgi:hypothetical protein
VPTARFLTLLKASFFASFGAGLGASLAFSFGLGLVTFFTSPDIAFDCSTLEYCGMTVANAALAIIIWFAGAAGLALFASAACYIFAFPAVFMCGSILASAASRQPDLARPVYWIAAGAILGVAWWLTLWHLQWLPDILEMHAGEIGSNLRQPSWPMIVAAAFAGMMAAWMYRIWWRSETVEAT